MKKSFSFVVISVAILLLSGCSLPSGSSGASGSVRKSTDGGTVWEIKSKIDEKTVFFGDVLNIAINPFFAGNAFIGTREGGILKTENSGENWKHLNFQSEKVYGLVVDPTDGKIIYASGVWQKRGKIWKSLDAGENWKEIYTAPSEGPLVISLIIDRKNPAAVYASTSDNQVIKTADGGATWKNIFAAPGPILKVAIDTNNSNLLYAVAQGRGVFRSRNGGQDFENMDKQIFEIVRNGGEINAVETDPANGSWVYLAGKAGLLRSKNAGESWEKLEILNDPQNFPIKTLAINPKNSNEIIYGAAKAVYKSIDAGKNWATFQLETAKTANVIKYSEADPNVVYLGLSK